MKRRILIVGLGNPGEAYEETRHNLGFKVVDAWAQIHGWEFSRERRLKGKLAQGELGEDEILLLKPSTYMNRSGLAVGRLARKCQISAEDHQSLLILVDDVYLPWGSMRFRPGGSCGGHNGLASIEESLGTKEYPRLRLGVGPGEDEEARELQETLPLEEYVLGQWTEYEKQTLSLVCQRAINVIESWLQEGSLKAAQVAGEMKQRPLEK